MYNGSHTNSSTSSYGSYYNARVANTIGATTAVSAGDYTNNICAKNWTILTELQRSTLSGSQYVSAFAPTFAGDYLGTTLNKAGSVGYWWCRTAINSTSFYYLNGQTSGLGSGSKWDIRYGKSVRCLSK